MTACIASTAPRRNVPRARFTVDEVVQLTLDFYRRNYIEGLFLSSGIIRSADYTMEQMVAVARTLREQQFRGYIHLKTIPGADDALIAAAGLYADRLSINIELPEEDSLPSSRRRRTAAPSAAAWGGCGSNSTRRRRQREGAQDAERQSRRASRRPARARR